MSTSDEKGKPVVYTPRSPAAAAVWMALYLLLCASAFLTALPFAWMLFGSFKTRIEAEETNILPKRWVQVDASAPVIGEFDNYAIVLRLRPDPYSKELLKVHFAKWYFNSLFTSIAVTFLQLLTSAMAAYAFSRIRWPGRDQLFFLYLATIMIPGVVLMIPNFRVMVAFGLIDTYAGLIVPSGFTAFGTFLLRQFMLGIPNALDEAALIDGARHWDIFWDVIMPLTRPGLVALAIFTMLGSFQSFFWPLVLLKTEHLYTLPIGMLNLDSTYGKQTELILAATVMSVIPLIILFVLLQKQLIKGIQLGAVKG